MSTSEGKAPALYSEYHPRWYRTRVSTWWWLGRWYYLKFILREISSIAVAFAVVQALLLVRAVARGPEAFAHFQATMKSPWMLGMSLIAFGFVVFHSVTWFNLAPQAMVVRVRGRRVPPIVIAAQNYLAWIVATAVVAWFLLRK